MNDAHAAAGRLLPQDAGLSRGQAQAGADDGSRADAAPGAMRTVWLHIGMLKTGTTTLQAFLYLNRIHLARYGFHYPLCIKEVLPGLHEHNPVVAARPWQCQAL